MISAGENLRSENNEGEIVNIRSINFLEQEWWKVRSRRVATPDKGGSHPRQGYQWLGRCVTP